MSERRKAAITKRLLNFSTHPADLDIIGHDWDTARDFLARNGFDGFELYPVDGYDLGAIPVDLIAGLHLRYFPILEPMWRGDRKRMLEIFGDDETIESYYGGLTREAIVEAYRQQLALAERLGCGYVVFHVAQNEPEAAHGWQSPWTWQETVGVCAEVIDEVMRDSAYSGEILFENLWWPGGLRLDSPDEVALLLKSVEYPRCGLVLDTGHVLNKSQDIRSEAEGIAYLIQTVRDLGEFRRNIKGVHLTRSLSADYVTRIRNGPSPFHSGQAFWERSEIAVRRIIEMDQHDAFDDPGIARLFDFISPEYVVFEFGYGDLAEWQAKIDRQKRALGSWE